MPTSIAPRVLIAEDDAELRGVLLRGLAEEGFAADRRRHRRRAAGTGRDGRARPARRRRRPAGRRRTRRLPGAAGAGSRHADPVPDGAGGADRPGRRLQRGRRRLPDEAVRVRRAGRAAARAAAARGHHRSRSRPAGSASTRSPMRPMRESEGPADADGVPPARAPDLESRRGCAPPRPDPHRVAARRARAREHARRLRRPSAPQARALPRRAAHHDRARRRLLARMSVRRTRCWRSCSWRSRPRSRPRRVGFNLIFSQASAATRDSLLRERASAELALIDTRDGRLDVHARRRTTSPGTATLDLRRGRPSSSRGGTPPPTLPRARSPAAPERFLDVAFDDDAPLRACPISEPRPAGSARSSSASRSRPTSRPRLRAARLADLRRDAAACSSASPSMWLLRAAAPPGRCR